MRLALARFPVVVPQIQIFQDKLLQPASLSLLIGLPVMQSAQAGYTRLLVVLAIVVIEDMLLKICSLGCLFLGAWGAYCELVDEFNHFTLAVNLAPQDHACIQEHV